MVNNFSVFLVFFLLLLFYGFSTAKITLSRELRIYISCSTDDSCFLWNVFLVSVSMYYFKMYFFTILISSLVYVCMHDLIACDNHMYSVHPPSLLPSCSTTYGQTSVYIDILKLNLSQMCLFAVASVSISRLASLYWSAIYICTRITLTCMPFYVLCVCECMFWFLIMNNHLALSHVFDYTIRIMGRYNRSCCWCCFIKSNMACTHTRIHPWITCILVEVCTPL